METVVSSSHSDSAAVVNETVQHADGRVELKDLRCIESSSLYNHDLAPIPVSKTQLVYI